MVLVPRRGFSIIVLSLLALGFLMVPNLSPVHAATGTICFADPTANPASPCPASPYIFNGPVTSPRTQLRVGVFVQGSDSMNGFAMILLANHTFLIPSGIDMTGSVLAAQAGPTTIIVECLSGVVVVGFSCSPADNVDTLEIAVAGSPGKITGTPTSGLLFTAIYNINATTSASGISVGFQTNAICNPSSVGPNICATISNGASSGIGYDLETARTGSFSNLVPPPYLTIKASPAFFGPTPPPVSGTSTISVTASSDWPGFSADQITFSVASSSGLTATLGNPVQCGPPAATCTVTLSLSASAAGIYSATVLGSYDAVDTTATSNSLSAVAVVKVYASGFSLNAPPSVSFPVNYPSTSTAIVSGLGNFTGTVALSQGPSSPTGLTLSFNPAIISLSPSTTSVVSTVTFGSFAQKTYSTSIIASSGGKTKTSPITVMVGPPVPSITLSANPATMTLDSGVVGTSIITVTPTLGFTGTVSLSPSESPQAGIACSVSPTSVTLGSAQTSTLSCSASPGTYTVTVKGTGPSVTNSTTVKVIVPTPGFSVIAVQQSLSILKGDSGTSSIQVSSLYGFAGTVTLSPVLVPTPNINPPPMISVSLDTTSLVLTSGKVLSATLTVKIDSTVPASNYLVNVTGTSGSLTEFALVYVTVPFPDFTISVSTASVVFVVGSSGTSTVTVNSQNRFSSPITLAASAPTGIICSMAPVTVSLGVSASSVLSCSSSQAGSFNVTVTGSGSALVHATFVIFKVQDFKLTALATVIPVNTGDTGRVTISVADVANTGFDGSVTLTVSKPAGLNAALSASTVQVPGSSTLTFSSSTDSSYAVTVTGTSGSISHSITITVNVTTHSGTSTLFGLPPVEFFGIVGFLVVLAIAGGVFALQRSRRAGRRAKS